MFCFSLFLCACVRFSLLSILSRLFLLLLLLSRSSLSQGNRDAAHSHFLEKA